MEPLPTFIINLPESTERRARILTATSQMPFLDVLVVEAIDGKAISEEQRKKMIHPRYSRIVRSAGMSRGELGCALSHRKCYEHIIEKQLKYALILEDDVLLGQGFEHALDMACDFLENHLRPSVILLSARTVCSSKSVDRLGGLDLRMAYTGVGAYCYIVNSAGAKLLHENGIPYRFPADHWFKHRRDGILLYAVVPHVASFFNDRSDSTIHSEREELWAQFTKSQKFKCSFINKTLSRFTYERIYIKAMKVFGGGKEAPKLWPKE